MRQTVDAMSLVQRNRESGFVTTAIYDSQFYGFLLPNWIIGTNYRTKY
jgi:hypothetical protein